MSRITLDEYMAMLVQRQEEWFACHPGADRRFPPLLEWFIRDGDEDIVAIPPKRMDRVRNHTKTKPRTSMRPRSVDDTNSEIARIEERLNRLGRPLSDDPASARLGDARALRRHRARMDRELEEYARLTKRLRRLRRRLTAHGVIDQADGR